MSMFTDDQIRALPKAEVHVHLEGGFELPEILELAKENRVALPGPASTLFDITTHTGYTAPAVTTGGTGAGTGAAGLSGFLLFLDWQCGLVQNAEQAARQAYRFAARQSASGVRYTDAIINPTHWRHWRHRLGELLSALAAGFDEAQQDGLCVVNLCVSLLRQQTGEEAVNLVDWLIEHRPPRVAALSVDGDERAAGRTGPRFAEAFSRARAAGLRRTVHAGESSGPEGVWDAVKLLHAERIDHGIRAAEDPALVQYLAEAGIPLDICPRSNVTLGVVDGWEDHPFLRLREAGVRVTLNTDDPGPLHTTLEADWSTAAARFGLTAADLVGLAQESVRASFADASLQEDLLEQIAGTVAGMRLAL